MRLLALDTCDARGSVAVLEDRTIMGAAAHPEGREYSSWLLPAVDRVLALAHLTHADLDGYAVASGPGSFTGVRVGLTTVKAWSEVFRKPVAAVSRLEALAGAAAGPAELVAPCFDAQRGQVFGGLYRRTGERLELVEEEMVAPPDAFLEWVLGRASGQRVSWISLDPQVLASEGAWRGRIAQGDTIQSAPSELASSVGLLGLSRLLSGQKSDTLHLDANYVRRSDAELFWKKSAGS